MQKVEAELVGEAMNKVAMDKAVELCYGQEIILDTEHKKNVDFTPITNKLEMNR